MGKLITFEGLDGVGKTTIVDAIYSILNEKGIKSVRTREPGGTYYAECIRKLLKEHKCSPKAQLFALISARCSHVDLIDEYIHKGNIVLCDRYIDSTFAYQGAILGIDYVSNILSYVNHRIPDLTILVEGKIYIEKDDRIYSTYRGYLNKIKENYNKIKSYNRVIVVDNSNIEYEQIVKQIIEPTENE